MSAMSDTLRSVVDSRVRKPRPRMLRRANQADSISILGIEMPFPCSAYQYASRSCRISETSADCAECVRRGSKDCDVGLSMAQVNRLKETKDRLQQQLEEAQDAELVFEESRLEAERSQRAVRMRQRQIRKQLAFVDVRANEMLAKEEIIRQRLDAQEEADMAALAAVIEENVPVGSEETVVVPSSGAPLAPTVPTLDQEVNSFYSSWIAGNGVSAPGS